jgi:hypothetical protein
MGLLDGNTGGGPGDIAPDGSPVGRYDLLPAGGELERIHGAIPAGASILELGAGAGRVAKGLLAFGHPVVAMDESAPMLARIEGAETVCAPIPRLEDDYLAGLLTGLLADVGLRLAGFVGGDRGWVLAVPEPAGAST